MRELLSRRPCLSACLMWGSVVVLLLGCDLPPVDYTGKSCPCLEPWVCGDDDLCYRPGEDDAGADADVPADADSSPDADEDIPAGAVRGVVCGLEHSCALLGSGALRCWGRGDQGALGYGNTDDIGDDEAPAAAGDVPVGGTVVRLATRGHTCAVVDGGALRCFGDGSRGQLGRGDVVSIGDDETPAAAGDAEVGEAVRQVAVGASHSCAVLTTGAVRCWGAGDAGQLGYGNTEDVGDNETPTAVGDVDVGGPVVRVVAGELHSCALLEAGGVRCWGASEGGRLGYRNSGDVGDDETPASVGDVDLGGPARLIAAGGSHTCALLESGAVRCWGVGSDGRLGYGNERNVGDNETPASAGDVELGGTVVSLTAGLSHSCALFDTGSIRCWGAGGQGQLGYGSTAAVGDNETPAEAGYVNVGGLVTQVSAGGDFTCALLDTGVVRCWGSAAAIGLGYPENVGDDEPPASAEPVPLIL